MTDDQARRDEVIEVLEQANLGIYGDYDRSGEEMVADALLPLLARIEREAKAEAWDEGYEDGETMARLWGHTDHWEGEPTNPYRAALDEPTGEACDCYTPQECERLGHKR